MDLRNLTDCTFYLKGCCRSGDSCPFRHDPAKIGAFKQIQSNIDCVYFLQGCCRKGSLCPYAHDPAKLNPALAAAAGLAGGQPAVFSPAAAVRAKPEQQQQNVMVDFTVSADTQPAARAAAQPMQVGPASRPGSTASVRAPSPALANGSRPASSLGAGSGRQPTDRLPAPKLPVPLPPQQKRKAEEPAASLGGIPARLAGRLGLPLPTHASTDGDRQQEARAQGGRRVEVADASAARPARRRPVGASGLASAVIQEVLATDAHGSNAEQQQQQQQQRKRRQPQEAEAAEAQRGVKRVVEVVALEPSPPQKRAARPAGRAGAEAPRGRAAAPASPSTTRQGMAPASAPPGRAANSQSGPARPGASQPAAAAPAPAKPAPGRGTGSRAAGGQQKEEPKPEPIDFVPPKSIAEIRKERQQKKKQPATAGAAPPAKPASQPTVPSSSKPVAPAAASKPPPPAQQVAQQQQREEPAVPEEDEEFEEDFEEVGDAAAGDLDDFEAQMRALEEAL